MHLEARPFDPVTFEKEEEAIEDEVTGEVKVRLRDESTIRWRIVPDGQGTTCWYMLHTVCDAVSAVLVLACLPVHAVLRMVGISLELGAAVSAGWHNDCVSKRQLRSATGHAA